MSMTTRAAVCREPRQPWEITELRAGRAEGQRGPDQVLGGRAVPLRRPHPEGRRADAHARGRRARGRGSGRGGRRGRDPGEGRRPRRLLVHPRLRQVPVLLHRPAEPVRRGRRTPAPACSPTARSASTTTTARTSAGCACSAPSPSTRSSRECSVHPDPDDIPFEVAALVGCGVPTGWGTAVYAAGVRAGPDRGRSTAPAAWAATRCRAPGTPARKNVVVVDPVEFKREMAEGLRGDAHLRHAPARRTSSSSRPPGASSPTTRSSPSGSCTTRSIQTPSRSSARAGQVTITAVGNGMECDRARRHADRLPAPDPGRHLRRLQPARTTSRGCSGSTAPATSSSTS